MSDSLKGHVKKAAQARKLKNLSWFSYRYWNALFCKVLFKRYNFNNFLSERGLIIFILFLMMLLARNLVTKFIPNMIKRATGSNGSGPSNIDNSTKSQQIWNSTGPSSLLSSLTGNGLLTDDGSLLTTESFFQTVSGGSEEELLAQLNEIHPLNQTKHIDNHIKSAELDFKYLILVLNEIDNRIARGLDGKDILNNKFSKELRKAVRRHERNFYKYINKTIKYSNKKFNKSELKLKAESDSSSDSDSTNSNSDSDFTKDESYSLVKSKWHAKFSKFELRSLCGLPDSFDDDTVAESTKDRNIVPFDYTRDGRSEFDKHDRKLINVIISVTKRIFARKIEPKPAKDDNSIESLHQNHKNNLNNMMIAIASNSTKALMYAYHRNKEQSEKQFIDPKLKDTTRIAGVKDLLMLGKWIMFKRINLPENFPLSTFPQNMRRNNLMNQQSILMKKKGNRLRNSKVFSQGEKLKSFYTFQSDEELVIDELDELDNDSEEVEEDIIDSESDSDPESDDSVSKSEYSTGTSVSHHHGPLFHPISLGQMSIIFYLSLLAQQSLLLNEIQIASDLYRELIRITEGIDYMIGEEETRLLRAISSVTDEVISSPDIRKSLNNLNQNGPTAVKLGLHGYGISYINSITKYTTCLMPDNVYEQFNRQAGYITQRAEIEYNLGIWYQYHAEHAIPKYIQESQSEGADSTAKESIKKSEIMKSHLDHLKMALKHFKNSLEFCIEGKRAKGKWFDKSDLDNKNNGANAAANIDTSNRDTDSGNTNSNVNNNIQGSRSSSPLTVKSQSLLQEKADQQRLKDNVSAPVSAIEEDINHAKMLHPSHAEDIDRKHQASTSLTMEVLKRDREDTRRVLKVENKWRIAEMERLIKAETELDDNEEDIENIMEGRKTGTYMMKGFLPTMK